MPVTPYDDAAPASQALFARGREVTPGGVNSPVRAFRAVGGTPRFMASGTGPWITDVDGRRYLDLVCSWGPMVLGHAHPDVVEAVRSKASQGFSFGTPGEGEVLVRDVRGHFSLNPVPALQKALGVNLGIARHEQTQEALIFRRTEVVGGFNRKWGMPLPQVTALAAGSVFVLTAEHPIAAEALQTLEDLGLGERRAEGYGRVAINWYESAPPQFTKDTSQRLVRAAHAVTLTTAERRLAQAMLDRQFRRDLEQKLLKAINELDISGALPNSQLSRWRSVIHSALALKEAAQQLDRLNQFRAHEADKNSRAWERLRRARLVGRNLRLTEWIEDVLTHTDAPWHWFPADAKPVPLKLSEDLQSRLTDDLAIEFRLRLLDGVLARHAKLQPGQDKQSGGNQ